MRSAQYEGHNPPSELSADLTAWANLIQDHPHERPQAEKALRHWKADGDLAGIRDVPRLAQLPPEEQDAFRKLWTDVDALLQQAPKE